MSFNFASRHNGSSSKDIEKMLEYTGASSLDELIAQTVPADIRLQKPLHLPAEVSEFELLQELKNTASKNKLFKTYIGLGYYNTIVPGVIKRNILENPGWYTAYTPYQAEIAQGRLEALLNFQTMITDLTGMDIANASLLDEATAAAEAMLMFFNTRSREGEQRGATRFFVSGECFPQTISVLKLRAAPLNIQLDIGDAEATEFDDTYFGALIQYPSASGAVYDYSGFMKKAQASNIPVAVAADIMSLLLLTPPGKWGASVVVGSTQRFGIPPGFGGPHAAYFASREEYKRHIPGRIIGVSVDAQGNRALRMALQTREQHIRREKATSNICTSQVLLAVMASMYAVYHGPEGLRHIATRIHNYAKHLDLKLRKAGFKQVNNYFFDTLFIRFNARKERDDILRAAIKLRINLYCPDPRSILLSVDETTTSEDIEELYCLFEKESFTKIAVDPICLPPQLTRSDACLTHPVFNTYHTETEMLRYIKKLENKDLTLTHSMIPLGSCTMKLNATTEMAPVTWPEFSNLHPFVPAKQSKGYQKIILEFEKFLCEITGLDAVSLQPNSGAQGEYAGLMVIRQYHLNNKEAQRNVALIPASAHGTNPASAVMAGMNVVVVKCDDSGNIDMADLKEKATLYKKTLAVLMLTYPSTHGVFEENVKEMTGYIHRLGGQVYMDGANMNAQVGLTNPAQIGADVCHINLHKTFCIPHGGGGPGMGPIAVAKHLAAFLPSHPVVNEGSPKSIQAVSAAPYGSANILLISYAYIRLMGANGLTEATKTAILNANYIKARLAQAYPVLYQGKNGRVAHEVILDCRPFKHTAQVEVEDIAKRLMDYGFHAPTVSFPVPGTLMIEPTESESKAELDRFCDALLSIRKEITEIEEGTYDRADNVLKNAPHTAAEAISPGWNHAYTREKAIFPAPWIRENKFWPSVSRVDNAYGDRNLICTCGAASDFQEATAHIS